MTISRPRLIIIAGPNGSGKTSITEQLLAHTWMEGCTYVNPDNIAQEKFGGWNVKEAIRQAADEAQCIREECLAGRKDLAFETVFSSPEKIQFVLAAKKAGFFVRLFFICTDGPQVNASRIIARSLEGGHQVPMEKIISRFSKSIAQCAAVIRRVDRAYVYDNSVDGRKPLPLFRAKDGVLEKRYQDVNEWAQPIFRQLRRDKFREIPQN